MINLKTYSIVISISYFLFGISLLTYPNAFLTLFGCPLDSNGEMVARTFAASLLGGAVMHFMFRNAQIPNVLAKYVFVGNLVFNSISAPVMAHATINGIMNSLGFMPVLLNIFLAVLSAYMLFYSKRAAH